MPSGYLIPHHYPTFFSIPDRTWSSFESDLAMGSPKDQVLPNYLGKPDTSGKADIPGYPWFQVYQPWHGMPCIRLQTHLAHFLQKKDNTWEYVMWGAPNTRNTKPEPARLPDFFSLPDSLLKNPTRWYLSFAVVLPCASHFCIYNGTANLAFVWMCYKGCKSYYT